MPSTRTHLTTGVNVLQACVATLLGVSMGDLPTEASAATYWEPLQRWLAGRGLQAMSVPLSSLSRDLAAPIACVLVGVSPRDNTATHAVCGELSPDGVHITHDPHPDQRGLDGRPYAAILLLPTSCNLRTETAQRLEVFGDLLEELCDQEFRRGAGELDDAEFEEEFDEENGPNPLRDIHQVVAEIARLHDVVTP